MVHGLPAQAEESRRELERAAEEMRILGVSLAPLSLRGPWAVLTSIQQGSQLMLDTDSLSPLHLRGDGDSGAPQADFTSADIAPCPAVATAADVPAGAAAARVARSVADSRLLDEKRLAEDAAAQRLVAAANQTAVALTRRGLETGAAARRWRARESLYRAEHTKLLQEGLMLRDSLAAGEIECHRAKEEAQAAQAALTAERASAASFREKLAAVLRETETAAASLASEQAALLSQRAECDALRQAVEREQREADALRASLAVIETRRAEQWDEIVALGDETARCRREAEALRGKLGEEQTRARAFAAQVEESRRGLAQAAEEVRMLDGTLARLQLTADEEADAAQLLRAELERERRAVAEARVAAEAERDRLRRSEAERRSLAAAVEIARGAHAARRAAGRVPPPGTSASPCCASFSAGAQLPSADAALGDLFRELVQRRQQLSLDVSAVAPPAAAAAAAVAAVSVSRHTELSPPAHAWGRHGEVAGPGAASAEALRAAHEQLRALVAMVNRATTAINVHKAAARQLQVRWPACECARYTDEIMGRC
jgi:hypothetical protein